MTDQTYETSPSVLFNLLANALEEKAPIVIQGAPGIGKSDIVKKASWDYVSANSPNGVRGQWLVDFRAATRDPVDLHGVPTLHRVGDVVRTAWSVPDYFPTEDDIKEGRFNRFGVVFLDELMLAPPSMQGALLGFVLDREVGRYRLPDEWAIVCAGNRAQDKAGAFRLISALADRVTIVSLAVNHKEWLQWATSVGVHPDVIATISMSPSVLHTFSPEKELFATPRGWEKASRWLKRADEGKNNNKSKDPDWLTSALTGTIGVQETATLLKVRRQSATQKLVSVDDILANPEEAPHPENAIAMTLIASALGSQVTDKNIGNITKYLIRVGSAEMVALALSAMTATLPNKSRVKSSQDWQTLVAFAA